MKLTRVEKKELLFLLFSVTMLFSAIIVFNQNTYPLFIDDPLHQSYPFFYKAYNLPLTEVYTSWDWNNFTGADYLCTTAFYYSTYPITYLLKIFPEILAPYFPFVMNYINFILTTITGFFYCKMISKNSLARIVGTLIIVYNGFTIGFFKFFLLNVFWMIPVILMAIEIYLKNKKISILVLSFALTTIFNYYFALLLIPFACLYALMRYFIVNDNLRIKHLFEDGAYFLFAIVLSLGLGAFILYPCILFTFMAPRINFNLNYFSFLNWKQFFRFLTGLISPIMASNNHNYFISVAHVDSWLTYGGGPVVYSLILPLITLPQLFIICCRKAKLIYGCIITFLSILILMKGIYPLLNGNWDSRWMYMVIFFISYFSIVVLSQKERISKKLLIKTAVVLLLFIGNSLYLTYTLKLYDSIYTFKILFFTEMVVIILIFIYITFFIANKFKYIYPLLVVEIILCVFHLFWQDPNKAADSLFITKNDFKEQQSSILAVIDYIKEHDSGAYRISESGKARANLNHGYILDYMSFTLYNSLYNYYQEDYLSGRFKGYGQWVFFDNPGNWLNQNLLGSKYYIDYHNDESYIPWGYCYLDSVNGIDIYENQYFIPFGYALENAVDEEYYNSLSLFEQNRILLNHVVVPSGNYQTGDILWIDNKIPLGGLSFGSTLYSAENLNGYIFVQELSNYSIKADRGFELYSNHKLIDNHFYTYYDYPLVFKIDERVDEFYINVDTQTTLGYSLNYQLYYDDMSWYNEFYNNLIEESFQNVQIDANSLCADIKVNSEKWIVTSVGYSNHWNVFANNEKLETLKVNNGFVGFFLPEGEYHIEMVYNNTDKTIGIVISIVSLVMTMFIIKKDYYIGKVKNYG